MEEQIHFSIPKTRAKYGIAFLVIIALVSLFSFRLGQQNKNFSNPIKKILPTASTSDYLKVDLEDLVGSENISKFRAGQKIITEGYFYKKVHCTEIACTEDNPCCNGCGGTVQLIHSDSWEKADIRLTLYKNNHEITECSGNECDFTCDIDVKIHNGIAFSSISVNKYKVKGEIISIPAVETVVGTGPRNAFLVESYEPI